LVIELKQEYIFVDDLTLKSNTDYPQIEIKRLYSEDVGPPVATIEDVCDVEFKKVYRTTKSEDRFKRKYKDIVDLLL
jgi:hypothetical protein